MLSNTYVPFISFFFLLFVYFLSFVCYYFFFAFNFFPFPSFYIYLRTYKRRFVRAVYITRAGSCVRVLFFKTRERDGTRRVQTRDSITAD